MNLNLLGPSILGLVLLAVGGWMLWRKKSRKIVTWMWLVAGFCLSGVVVTVLAAIFGKAGQAGSKLFGVTATVLMTVVAVVMLLEIWHGARPRKGTPAGHTPVLALIAPVLLGTAAGGVLAEAYIMINDALGTLGGPVAAFFGG